MTSVRSTPAWAARTVSCAATSVRYASAAAVATSNCVRLSVASDWDCAAAAAATVARRSPKSNGSQVTRVPIALPQAVPRLLEPITGPDMEGIVLCGSSSPKTLLRVARFTCASVSTRGR